MRTGVIWAALLLAASTARAQERVDASEQDPQRETERQQAPVAAQQQAPVAPQQQQAVGPTSDAFDRACIDLLHGRTPQGEKAIEALRDACSNLMAGRVDDRLEAERRRKAQLAAQEALRLQAEGRVQPGQAAAPVEPGTGVLAAFEQAGSELVGRGGTRAPMGMRRRGPVGLTIVTNPVGWFNGLGVNAEVFAPIRQQPKFSWVAGARYSSTDATNGTVSTFGAMGGVDLFIIGRNNEGFRVGPRIEVAAGREEFQGDTTFARLGFGGELGYNFIASNGITGLVAGGLGGRVAGDDENDDFESFVGGEFGPYIKLGLGFSW
jgi:hypothetical protein